MLNSLNLYSGYLIARGNQEKSVKFNLASKANSDRLGMLSGQLKAKPKLTIPKSLIFIQPSHVFPQ
jgi:hypothetical protein